MNGPRHAFVPVMDHEIHVALWGDPSAPPIVMWHGLARTGRDFDELALALSDNYFVLCPDTIGRGLSSWSTNPTAEYSIEYYAGIAEDILDHFEIRRAGWIGTSMGGLIGMHVASGTFSDKLSFLIVNDIAPEVPQAAIDRILKYANTQPSFATYEEAEAWHRAAYAPFGQADDSFWQRIARTSVRRTSNGQLTTHYDPQITVQFTASPSDFSTWDRYARIETPTHVFRGETSDILLADLAERMAASGPRPKVTVFEGCGHAPPLARPEDAELVRKVIADLS